MEKEQGLVRQLTEVVEDAYELPREAITVLIQEYPKENIGVAGELIADR